MPDPTFSNDYITYLYQQVWHDADEAGNPHNRLLEAAEQTGNDKYLKEAARILTNFKGELVLFASNIKAENEQKTEPKTANWQGLNALANNLEATQEILSKEAEVLDDLAKELPSEIDPQKLQKFQEYEDNLRKQASVLDAILLSIGAPKDAIENFKKAEDEKIDKLREEYRRKKEDMYSLSKKRDPNTPENAKKIHETFKEYRPMEATLQIRTCPDHPGEQMMRIADGVYQCQMDKQIYDWNSGFTTSKGNKVPGGSVQNQSQNLHYLTTKETSFDTREQRAARQNP